MKKGIEIAVLLLAILTLPALADDVTGTLYYTTFAGGQNVWKVGFNYNGTTFTLGPSTNIASTNGADGLLFLPNGNLAVAGQGGGTDFVSEVNPTTGAIINTPLAGTGSYHLALTPGPSPLLYTMWNGPGEGPSAISALPISGSGGLNLNGTAYTCSSASTDCDVRGVVYDPVTGKFYYSSAPDGSTGHAGVIVFNDTTHTFTTTAFGTPTAGPNTYFSHGISFDPFTGDLIVNAGACIQQLDTTGAVVSQICHQGSQFDQAAEDGNGHLFVASNNGDLFFVDYDKTGLIGAATDFTSDDPLHANLDDIAPIAGLGGGGQTPEPGTWVLLLSGLATGIRLRRRK